MNAQNQQTYETTVMIAGDNHEFLEGVKLALEMEGGRAISAATGQKALNTLERAGVTEQSGGAALKQLPDIITENLRATLKGKLKRVEQRKTINEKFFDNFADQSKSGGIAAISIIGTPVIFAFYLGILVATYLL